MSLPEAVTTVLQKYVDFSGRARRSEYWWWILAYCIALGVAQAISIAIHTEILYLLVILAVILPTLSVGVRRLHDTDRSGWWILINIIPLIGAIIFLVFTVSDSTPGDNQYGPSPKAVGGGYGGDYNPNPNAGWS